MSNGNYFVYDPENGIDFYDTQEQALDAAKSAIDGYLDDGWGEGVDQIVVGVVTHESTQTNLIKREGELDEDGHDEAGEYWGNPDWTYRCDYEMLPLVVAKKVEEAES